MSIICTVEFNVPVKTLAECAADYPELIDGIRDAANGLMLSHARYERDGRALDIDEYASQADYETFRRAAEFYIARVKLITGAHTIETLWTRTAETLAHSAPANS